MVAITVPENYGAVIGIALGGIPFLGFIHGFIVTGLRKEAKVPYPHSYATIEECRSNAKAEQFNCAQRAHSNFLENASQTMFFTLVAGLKYPQLATGLGAAWLVFRSLFLYGYHSCVVGNKGRGRSSGHDVKEYWLIKQTRDSESPNRSPSLKMLSCSFASLTYRIGEALMISSAFSLINSRHTFSIPFPKADIATMHTAG